MAVKLSIIMDRYDFSFVGMESQDLGSERVLEEKGWNVRFAVFRSSACTRNRRFLEALDDFGFVRISGSLNLLREHRYGRWLKFEGFSIGVVVNLRPIQRIQNLISSMGLVGSQA